ncbi:MAG: hypothetical protein D6719_12430 [Candidatus Dadabacteria bacterium]|nr:MAG: hypothetical protein D6719_12430 [Candidatus Dadabacteria bacterium]
MNSKFVLTFPVIYIALLYSLLGRTVEAEPKDLIVDAVVASVDDEPVTLRELCLRLTPPRKLTVEEAGNDPEALAALDNIIMERLLSLEAKKRRIIVTDQEVERYIDQVAKRNSLSRKEFERALLEKGQTIDNYRRQIKMEIIKTRLAGKFIKGGVGVTDEEIDQYLKNSADASDKGLKIRLSQIFVSKENHSEEEAKALITKAKSRLADGEDFAEVARSLSEGPEASEGGSLGVINLEDLNSSLFDAVLSLQEGQISDIVSSPAGYHILRVDKRFNSKTADNSEMREEARKFLARQKIEEKMKTFFTGELFITHVVEKKI